MPATRNPGRNGIESYTRTIVHATPAWYAWSGYAFENLCLQQISAIKKALGIAGKYAGELRNKVQTFRRVTRIRKALFLTLVTTYGVKANDYQAELVQNSIAADVLFDA